jgi:hypothetical protein
VETILTRGPIMWLSGEGCNDHEGHRRITVVKKKPTEIAPHFRFLRLNVSNQSFYADDC